MAGAARLASGFLPDIGAKVRDGWVAVERAESLGRCFYEWCRMVVQCWRAQ